VSTPGAGCMDLTNVGQSEIGFSQYSLSVQEIRNDVNAGVIDYPLVQCVLARVFIR
jgi:hypothetical protein